MTLQDTPIIPYLTLLLVIITTTIMGPLVARWIFIRKPLSESPWWEQSRAFFAVRTFQPLFVAAGVVPASLAGQFLFDSSDWTFYAPVGVYLLIAITSCRINSSAIARKIRPNTVKSSPTGQLAFLILFFSPIILTAIAAITLVPAEFSLRSLLIIGAVMICLIIWSLWLAVGFLRLIRSIVEGSDDLKKIVETEAAKIGMPRIPEIWEIKTKMANAFAIQTYHAVGFTTGLIAVADEPEIASIARHELAHLTESKKVLLIRRMTPLCLLPILFLKPCASIEPYYAVIPFILLVVLIRLNSSLMRKMEDRADSEAGEESQTEQAIYARALTKLYQANLTPAVLGGKGRSHPELYDRLTALGVDPGFPRPRPPRRLAATLLALAYWMVASAIFIGIVQLLLQIELL